MNTKSSTTEATTTASSVAPEDLACGDCIAVLNEVVEFPSFLWFDSALGEQDALVRVLCQPADGGMPKKVKAICLPFVFVKSPFGRYETIDIRKVRLARLKKSYAKSVWNSIRKEGQRTKRKCKRKSR